MIDEKMLEVLLDAQLKAKILRESLKSRVSRQQDFSEKELLTLQMAADFSPIFERDLRAVFGMAGSSTSELVNGLVERGMLAKAERGEDDARTRPLVLTNEGKKTLAAVKSSTAVSYDYLFSALSDQEQADLKTIISKVAATATQKVKEMVLGL